MCEIKKHKNEREKLKMKKYSIRWFDRKNGELIVRKFNGVIESETAETITFMYNKRLITRKKDECIIL